MPIPQKVLKFLEKNKIKHEPVKHRTVYTAYDKATTLGVPEKIVGKTLVMKLNGGHASVLIPANKKLDKGKFKKTVNNWLKAQGKKNIKTIKFASEAWMKNNLKGIKVGATPPFGKLWNLPTFIDRGLIRNPKIIVNSGDYNWSIKIAPNSLKTIPDVFLGDFSRQR